MNISNLPPCPELVPQAETSVEWTIPRVSASVQPPIRLSPQAQERLRVIHQVLNNSRPIQTPSEDRSLSLTAQS